MCPLNNVSSNQGDFDLSWKNTTLFKAVLTFLRIRKERNLYNNVTIAEHTPLMEPFTAINLGGVTYFGSKPMLFQTCPYGKYRL
jgi:hypothetical protein